ncbi:MAG: hypothetical protein D6712_17800 [Chloroflexi bacterium]|nr:MAG: hypothetical protein D6712_17800 [Chloroflexota bacterium]
MLFADQFFAKRAFNPVDLNPFAFFDNDRGDRFSLNGSDVAAWEDLGTNGQDFIQPVAVSQPAYQSSPRAVLYTESTKYLTANPFSFNTSNFTIAYRGNITSSNVSCLLGGRYNKLEIRLSTSQIELWVGDGSAYNRLRWSGFSFSGAQCLVFLRTGSQIGLRVNGSEQAKKSSNYNMVLDEGLLLGLRQNTELPFGGTVEKLFFKEIEISGDDLTNLETYFGVTP